MDQQSVITPYYIGRDFHHCVVDDAVVLLNCETGQYAALPPEGYKTFRRIAGVAGGDLNGELGADGGDDIADLSALNELLGLGVLTRDPRLGRPIRDYSLMTTGSLLDSLLLNHQQPSIRAGELLAFTASVLKAAWLLKVSRFADTIHHLQHLQRKAAIPPRSLDLVLVERLVASFRHMRLWTYSASRACLFDSLVLFQFLHRRGVSTTFVLGVRTKPFIAHAWVQLGDLVLNDSLERVTRFTPILVI